MLVIVSVIASLLSTSSPPVTWPKKLKSTPTSCGGAIRATINWLLLERGVPSGLAPAGMPTKVSQHLIDQTILFPTRMGRPDEFAGLVRHIVENAYLNATTISIDAGTRVGTR